MDTYSVKEIAGMLNTNPETVRRWIRSGKLEAIQESRKGGNVVTKAMLDAFLKNSPKYVGIATGLLALLILHMNLIGIMWLKRFLIQMIHTRHAFNF